jgi:hypothetical protein
LLLGIPIDDEACFSPDYRAPRTRVAKRANAVCGWKSTYLDPRKGGYGEELATDANRFSPQDAPKVLILVSATRGVEGFLGAGAQMDWLSGGPEICPQDTIVLLRSWLILPQAFDGLGGIRTSAA